MVSQTTPAHKVICVSTKLRQQRLFQMALKSHLLAFSQKEQFTKEFVILFFTHLQDMKILAVETPGNMHIPFAHKYFSTAAVLEKHSSCSTLP